MCKVPDVLKQNLSLIIQFHESIQLSVLWRRKFYLPIIFKLKLASFHLQIAIRNHNTFLFLLVAKYLEKKIPLFYF